ncbi:O-antigen ligase family protein [Mycolicibacterium sp. 050232]|uniref:O-antigen ligase family protein n=1 Tax=Mycolicibacterium sp. 050232 TaxID=3113982 RepID=UPI002E2A0A64|nr:O-antigen ligase family protein [Mycolicibacterium sp. 050232]MED5814331.1 O-antigen ligase family protein [Mycolicibacterium sp. 050232]
MPGIIVYLTVEYDPYLGTAEVDVPLSHLVRLGGSALLLGLCSAVALQPGRADRDFSGALLLLVAVNLPYLVSPAPPGPADLLKIGLANAAVLALWKMAAPIAQLKWVPIVVAAVAVYSTLGGLVLPAHFMYNQQSEKALVPGWELAGPLGHSNALGMWCGLAFTLTPLITQPRWRLFCATALFAGAVLAAARTSVIAAAFVGLFWLVCRFRAVVSVRLTGTVLACIAAGTMLVVPFLTWPPEKFSYRASVWASSLDVWKESPVFGLGVNWFLTDAQTTANLHSWAYVGTGHNVAMDQLVKSGLVGLTLLILVFATALVSARSLRVRNEQLACFGFLIAYFVIATEEAVWSLLPNIQLFPISGLIFVMLIVGQRSDESEGFLS